ncbi:unnamed protein product, partial [Scytosiphon promiscuus]
DTDVIFKVATPWLGRENQAAAKSSPGFNVSGADEHAIECTGQTVVFHFHEWEVENIISSTGSSRRLRELVRRETNHDRFCLAQASGHGQSRALKNNDSTPSPLPTQLRLRLFVVGS